MTVITELKKLAADLYSEGYHCGIPGDKEDVWFTVWAEAMRAVAGGEVYKDELVPLYKRALVKEQRAFTTFMLEEKKKRDDCEAPLCGRGIGLSKIDWPHTGRNGLAACFGIKIFWRD